MIEQSEDPDAENVDEELQRSLVELLGSERFAGEMLIKQLGDLVPLSAVLWVKGRELIEAQEKVGAAASGGAAAALYLAVTLDDMRACVAQLERGYPLQAIGTVAGMVDAVALFPRYCLDEEGAQRFDAHDNPAKAGSGGGTKAGLRAFASLVAPGLPMNAEQLFEHLAAIYQDTSGTKHKNPLTLRGSLYQVNDGKISVVTGPSAGGMWREMGEMGLGAAFAVALLLAIAFGRRFTPGHPVLIDLEAEAAEQLGRVLVAWRDDRSE